MPIRENMLCTERIGESPPSPWRSMRGSPTASTTKLVVKQKYSSFSYLSHGPVGEVIVSPPVCLSSWEQSQAQMKAHENVVRIQS